jgi:hypothetical protein
MLESRVRGRCGAVRKQIFEVPRAKGTIGDSYHLACLSVICARPARLGQDYGQPIAIMS